MWMTVGVLLAQILGGPLAAAFLSMDGVGGLKGWQVRCNTTWLTTSTVGLCLLPCYRLLEGFQC
jgi:hypothetical protein